jgi:hypothetical protein
MKLLWTFLLLPVYLFAGQPNEVKWAQQLALSPDG